MALDGIVIAGVVHQLNQTILNTKIAKIAQPEPDELLLTCKGPGANYRLALSASASLPFVYLTDQNKPSPMVAPTFCMVLRKHIANGKIVSITQPHMERIIRMDIEHLDEMGDFCKKSLIIELMGKHSNIIFCKEDGTIIDSIKHISSLTSSLREVLPGRMYEIPATQNQKHNPLTTSTSEFTDIISHCSDTLGKAVYGSFTGISPLMANEILYRAGADADMPVASYDEDQLYHIATQFHHFMDDVKEGHFSPAIIWNGKEPIEFSAFPLTQYQDYTIAAYTSISEVLELYYAKKNAYTRIRQKSADLRRIVTTALERNQKKLQLQLKQLSDTEKREKYRIYGELLQTYGYGVKEGSKFLVCENYYDDNKEIKIPLDETKSPLENAQKYFEKYNKLKRTYEALCALTEETQNEILHLESIQNALDIATSPDDLIDIKQELVDFGFIKKGRGQKKNTGKSKPLHYRSSDGFDIYVGKNNYQNDELTFKFATGNDWWFHAKNMPGSHVIVKSENRELPDRVFEEAASLAAYYSKGRGAEKVEIDYLQKKNVKKPNKSAPGFVVYYTNYSMTAYSDISTLTLVES
ncbi:MAG: NFACT RNA binding domain-containing protein [Agathobacter sp.]|nr:NFACT RNA binding domain-containing protein [Agathobacter sp.]